MAPVLTSRRLPIAAALGLVAFAFWPALFGGGSLVSADTVATAPPFASYQPDDFTLENGPGDPINIHAHWGSLATDVRAGEVGWWSPDLAGGQPTFKGGLPIFDVPYLVTPTWYAPGLVAALRALTAIGLSFGFLRAVGLTRVASLAGGVAFGFSGFMVGWMNWPHSSVAALAPGLLWAIERVLKEPRPWRAIPLGAVVAFMVWSNFPSVMIYVVLGTGAYAMVRAATEWRSGDGAGWLRSRVLVAGLAMAVAALLAAPHLIGFSEYVDWADTSQRVGNPDDSSAGVAYLMTAIAPAIWGSDAIGPSWFGEGNWVEYNAYAGASVVLLGSLGLVAAWRSGDRQRRSVAVGLGAIAGLGILIAYVGGVVGVGLGDLTGSQGGLMTRAKVLWSLGIALAAAFGVERLVTAPTADSSSGPFRRDLLWTGVLLGGAVIVMTPSILDWLDLARATGVLRETLAASATPMIAVGAVALLATARLRGAISGPVVGWCLVAVVGFELVSFAMPVPTIVDREERLSETPAHVQVRALLSPGERLAGEGRTFFPSTTELFSIDDARGQLLKSPGYQALLRTVDPDMLTTAGGGTPTYPNIAAGTDPASPVWDVLGIGVWAQFPDAIPHGTRIGPLPVPDLVDPSVAPISGRTTVPEGGLRGVLVRVATLAPGFVDITITTDDGTFVESRWVEPSDDRLLGIAVLGEYLRVGSPVAVEVTAPAPTLLVEVDDGGEVPVGTVAADDGLELVRVGDVLLFDRPVDTVRLVDAVEVRADPVEAATFVAARSDAGVGVVDQDLGLPVAPDPAATLRVERAVHGTDRVRVDVTTDRDALLVVSRSWYPGWIATVDGVEVETVVADAAVIGVPVGPGEHEVVLTFRPRHLGMSMLALSGGLLLVVGVLIDARRRGDLRSSARSAG